MVNEEIMKLYKEAKLDEVKEIPYISADEAVDIFHSQLKFRELVQGIVRFYEKLPPLSSEAVSEWVNTVNEDVLIYNLDLRRPSRRMLELTIRSLKEGKIAPVYPSSRFRGYGVKRIAIFDDYLLYCDDGERLCRSSLEILRWLCKEGIVEELYFIRFVEEDLISYDLLTWPLVEIDCSSVLEGMPVPSNKYVEFGDFLSEVVEAEEQHGLIPLIYMILDIEDVSYFSQGLKDAASVDHNLASILSYLSGGLELRSRVFCLSVIRGVNEILRNPSLMDPSLEILDEQVPCKVYKLTERQKER